MAWMTTKWMTNFFVLSASSAVFLTACTHRPPVNSFCQLYTEVIVAKGDGSIKATSGVKRRILVNEKLYAECPKGDK